VLFRSTSFQAFSPSQTTSPVIITGLTNGTTYTIELKAVNILGASIASESIDVFLPAVNNGSLLFNGTQHLSISTGVPLTNGNFTVEWYQYWNSTPSSSQTNMFSATAVNDQLLIYQNSPSQWQWQVYGIGGANTNNFATSQTFGQWYYMIYSINSSFQYTMYQNGIRSSSGLQTYSNTTSPSDFTLSVITTMIGQNFQGYITNFRVITGKNIYNPTQSAIPQSITNLTNVSGTQLLLNTFNNSNYLQDSSSNDFTISVVGTDAVLSTPETPFGTSIDRTQFNSLLFPTNSYFIMSPGISFGTNTTPFTVESWFYVNYDPSYPIVLLGSGGTGTDGYAPYPNNGLTFKSSGPTSWRIDSSGTASQDFYFPTFLKNTWYYIAVSRDTLGYVQMWVGTTPNGSATSSISGRQLLNSSAWNLTSATLLIGAWTNTQSFNDNTYVNNLRVTNTNLYNTSLSTIPVPSANLTNITGTQLLINNGAFVDASGNQTLTKVSGVSSSLAQPFS
jgi:hypothetical protein